MLAICRLQYAVETWIQATIATTYFLNFYFGCILAGNSSEKKLKAQNKACQEMQHLKKWNASSKIE